MNLLLKKIHLVLLFSAILVITGCSTATPKPTITDNFNGIHIYSTTSQIQSSFLKDKGSNQHFCDARGSDVADTHSDGFGISAALVGKNEGISESSSHGAVALGGRSPAVLITREVMYRTCEMIMNLDLDNEVALDLYIKTLELVTTLVKNDTNIGTAALLGAAQVQNVNLIESEIPVIAEEEEEEEEANIYNPRRR